MGFSKKKIILGIHDYDVVLKQTRNEKDKSRGDNKILSPLHFCFFKCMQNK